MTMHDGSTIDDLLAVSDATLANALTKQIEFALLCGDDGEVKRLTLELSRLGFQT